MIGSTNDVWFPEKSLSLESALDCSLQVDAGFTGDRRAQVGLPAILQEGVSDAEDRFPFASDGQEKGLANAGESDPVLWERPLLTKW